MLVKSFDLPPTGNNVVDALRVIDLQAQTIGDPLLREEFISERANEIAFDEIKGLEFYIVSRTVLARRPGRSLSKRLLYDRGLIFTGKVLTRSYVTSKADELEGITIDYYDPRISGAELIDGEPIARSIFQMPVLEADYCVPLR